jgi:hypothetical protein
MKFMIKSEDTHFNAIHQIITYESYDARSELSLSSTH